MLKRVFIKMQIKEANNFLHSIKVMDGDELGLLVAHIADIKNQFFKNGINLADPLTLHLSHPNLVVDMVNQVKALQKTNNQALAPGFMVWIFSLRAANDFELRKLAREIWGGITTRFSTCSTIN